MQALIKNGLEIFRAFHTSTKRILKYGLLFAFCFFGIAFCLTCLAPYTTEIYKWERVAHDFFICGKDLYSVFFIFGFLFEFALQGIDQREKN